MNEIQAILQPLELWVSGKPGIKQVITQRTQPPLWSVQEQRNAERCSEIGAIVSPFQHGRNTVSGGVIIGSIVGIMMMSSQVKA